MVDTFTQREVKPSSQPQEYLRVNYSPDAFGAQVGRALQSMGQGISNIGEMAAKLQQDKQANDALRAANEAKNELRPMLFDSEYGAFAQTGGNAMGIDKTIDAAMTNIKQKHLKSITDPRVREAFDKIWLREEEATKDRVALHQMKELSTYKNENSKATLLGSIQDAYNYYNDDKALGRAVEEAYRAIDANTMGLPPEAIAQAKQEAESSIYLAAISRWAAEDPSKALDFYTANKDKLSGKDHVTATGFVDAARKNRQAQNYVAEITGAGAAAGNLYDAVQWAESSNRPDAVSDDGALGLMQLMPGTAREVATAIGRADVAGLDDEQLKQLLTTDTALNHRLGQTYLNKQLQRYNGDVEAALVAYNAGPDWADKFLAANAGKPPGQRDYGLVPENPKLKSETEGYVKKVLGRMGVSEIPPGMRLTRENWDLKNFRPQDLMAPTAGGQWVDARAAYGLDELAGRMQQRFGVKVKINEDHDFTTKGGTAGKRRGTSDPTDNPHVSESQHLRGTAFDVQTQGWTPEQKAAFIAEARALGFGGIGFYGEGGHLHIDMGKERSWGTVPDWAKEAMKVPVGTPPGGAGAPQQGPQLPGGTWRNATLPGSFSSPGAFVDPSAGSLNSWLAQAQTIADPGIRNQVEQMLQIEAATREAAIKAQTGAIQQYAWDTVINSSVSNLTPDIISQLKPEFVSSLYTYEKNRASGVMPMDWKAWTDVTRMPEKELADVDAYTEYRNKLDDEHFDRLLTMQREARKKFNGEDYDKGLLANTRTRNQILDDIAAEQGWDPKRTSDQQLIAGFNRVLDERILAEQQAKGKELTAEEIQDLADKLLITDKYDGWGWDSNKPGYQTDDPDRFVAVESWDEVQPDDQKALIETYERFYGTSPDQDTAVDYYNRAMRVFLGGKPDGPDEEKKMFRDALEARLNVTLSNNEFDRHYGKYLLKFLGR